MPMPKRIVVNIEPELALALRDKRAETGVPTTEYIRRAIRLALFGDAQAARKSGTEQGV
jgi:hypothetical protein